METVVLCLVTAGTEMCIGEGCPRFSICWGEPDTKIGKSWRPNNWVKPTPQTYRMGPPTFNAMTEGECLAFETGADAILTELLDRGCYLEGGEEFYLKRKDGHRDHIEGPGWLVIIPDERKNG